MDPKHLPPAVLLALGLSVTQDGCCPWVPEVSDSPCLSVAPMDVCLSPPIDTAVGPCLEPVPVEDPPTDEPPAPEPCLSILPPQPPEPEHRVCLSPLPPPEPDDGGEQGKVDEPIPGTRKAALHKVLDEGVLPADVLERVRKG